MKLEDLKSELSNRKQLTENGAVGYATSGKELLDMNYQVSSMRNYTEEQIIDLFNKAFFENKLLAMKWLFFLRDVRGGLGERRSFRIIYDYLAKQYPDIAEAVMKLVPEYGRFDDLWSLLETDLKDPLIKFIKMRLSEDSDRMIKGYDISLLAKWLPSATTSSKESRRYASIIYNDLGISKAEYRVLLKSLRNYINVVESKISRNEWSDVDYCAVPSRANLLYKDAFMRHDKERRQEYLDNLSQGIGKMNGSANYPHDIVHKYRKDDYWGVWDIQYDESLEQLWKNLPDYGELSDGCIVVADGSGSMTSRVGNSSLTALDVANALAIYYAERLSGEFHDKYITFSENPKLVDLSQCKDLRDKIIQARKHDECDNTNIYRVFKLILNVGVKNEYAQDQMPKTVLILSDMEFDYGAEGWNETLFEKISKEYAKHGYKLPRLVFWNICGRTNTIPVKENELGVALVSGFSPSITDMVLSGELDPYRCLVNKLNTPRYKAVEEALEEIHLV